MKKLFLQISIIIFLLFIFITFSAFSYVNAVSKNISDSVFRLHVIANSDSNEDQSLKYLVRDSLLNYMSELTKNSKSKEEAMQLALNNKDTFYSIAKQVIIENGFNYNVSITFGNFFFPTKKYGDITLPCGNYDALKIEIGEAKGQNWWCVMFPPLCFIDVTSGIVTDESKKEFNNTLSSEEYLLISDTNNSEIKFKFRIIEFLNNL